MQDARQWLINRGAPITAGNLNSAQAFLIDNPDQRPSYMSGSDIEAAAARKYVGPDTVEQHDLPAMARVAGDTTAAAPSTAGSNPRDTDADADAAADTDADGDGGGTIGNKNPPQQAELDAAIDRSISGGDGNPSMAPAITQDNAEGAETTTAVDDAQSQAGARDYAFGGGQGYKPDTGGALKNALLAALLGAGGTAAVLAARRKSPVRPGVRSEPPMATGTPTGSAARVEADAATAPVEATSSYLNRAPRSEAQARSDVAGRQAAREAEREDNMRTPYQRQSALEGPSSGDSAYGRQADLEGAREQRSPLKQAMAAQKQSSKKAPPFKKKAK
jgi:hypothetical protein